MKRIKITALVENTAAGRGIIAEHGLSLWIELGDRKILFDTGQGNAIIHNSMKLGVRLEETHQIVLSHGHYDHTGGLDQILKISRKPEIFAHPAAFQKKFARHADGSVHDAGIPFPGWKEIASRSGLNLNDGHVEICEGFHLTGIIPRENGYEDTGGSFFIDKECTKTDTLQDDQAAFIGTAAGTIVILGCAHSGVINTLVHVQRLTGGRPIHTVVGGMHLVSARKERIDWTVEELKKLGLKRLMPAHCTGFPAMARLWQEFRDVFKPCNAGTVIEIGR